MSPSSSSPKKDFKTEWIEVFCANDWERFEQLIPKALKEQPELFFERDFLSWTPLQRASRNNLPMAQRILEVMEPISYIAPEVFKQELNDALISAAYFHDSHEFATALVRSGGNVDHIDSGAWKDTPLHVALRNTNWNFALGLLESGARSDMLNADGIAPLDTIGKNSVIDLGRVIMGTAGSKVERKVRRLATQWLSGQEIAQAALSRTQAQRVASESIVSSSTIPLNTLKLDSGTSVFIAPVKGLIERIFHMRTKDTPAPNGKPDPQPPGPPSP